MRKRKERGSQLLRVLKLVKLFEHSRYGMSINELCREMAVTRRTLYRDLEMAEDAGYRFVKDGGGGGSSKKWRFPPGMRKAPDKPYTESELLSLYFCMNLLQPFRGTPLRDGLESLLAKIEATFTQEEREYFGDLVFTHVAKMTPSKDYRRHAASVGALSRACLEHRKVEVTYRAGDDQSKTYAFSPYCIAYYGGELYTIGWSDLRNAVRTLRVDRIRTIKPLVQKFERPKDFDPEDYLGRSFGIYSEGEQEKVEIEFAKEAARTVLEREWHPTQRIEQGADGKVTLKMTVQGLHEVARWVLYHAPYAKALEPAELRELVAANAAKASEAHR
ncbi:MAG TPA: WYL domain-containing transcriptional regulator [Planctomycetota bacterium]|nr:WYL domain-containing transcriptional regulator [Planctomycetota bacterium]